MTALELLRPHTTLNAQERGREYLHLVDIVHGEADAVQAKVRGTGVYEVRLRRDGQKLRVWCTCPYFSDRGTGCKHVWATAERARGRGWLMDLPADARVVMDFKDLYDHELLKPEPAGSRGHEHVIPIAPPEWELALHDVRPKPHDTLLAAVAESQLLYILSVPPDATITEVPITVEKRTRKRDGTWSKPQPARLTYGAIGFLPDPDDRWALSLMHATSAIPRESGTYSYGFTSQLLPVAYVKAPLLDMVLHRLCDTGRVRLRRAQNVYAAAAVKGDDDVTLEWKPGEPWCLRVVVTRERAMTSPASGADVVDSDAYEVKAVVCRGERCEDVRRFALITDSITVLDHAAAPFDPDGGFAWARQIRSRGVLHVPVSSRRELVDSITASGINRIELPDDLQWEERTRVPRFRAVIGAPDAYGACAIDVSAEYDSNRAPLDGSPCVVNEDGTIVYRRDLDAERHALVTLKRLGAGERWHERFVPMRRVPAVVHALLAEGWSVEAHGVRYRALEAPRLHVKSGIDWFEVEAHAVDGGSLDLPEILKALKSGSRTVMLGDGTVGMLPEEWLARVAPLVALGDAGGGVVKFKPSQVALLDALLAVQPAVDWDEGFARAREALRRFQGVRPEDPPPTFHGALREYQREALGWMRFLREFGFGGCLADDMGLGKTVMVLAMLELRRLDPGRPHRPSVVVLPRSLLFNWVTEAGRFTPELRVLDFAHAERHAAIEAIADHDLILTTYGTLRRDVAALQDQQFDYVILDEAQAIKNAATATAKAVRLLAADHRLALTGTPVENHLGELQSLFDFLNPGLLGRGDVFDLKRVSQLEVNDYVRLVAKGLRPFFLRRTKEAVAPELPARTEETLYCELEGEQLRVYRELRDHYRRVLLEKVEREGVAKSKLEILQALLRLRQAACHTALLKSNAETSAKFDLLLPRLAELVDEGRKALVFSQFTSLLALLRDRLDANGVAYEYLDGQTRDRAARVVRFQEDAACPLFLISLKAGGVGLNLTAAEYVFLLDPWWNPAAEAQAIDRTHRIGQTNPVFAYRLVARETVEERILELQSRKRALADAILEAGAGGLRGLQREDLEQLLS